LDAIPGYKVLQLQNKGSLGGYAYSYDYYNPSNPYGTSALTVDQQDYYPALSFNGTSDGYTFNQTQSISQSQAYTVAGWVFTPPVSTTTSTTSTTSTTPQPLNRSFFGSYSSINEIPYGIGLNKQTAISETYYQTGNPQTISSNTPINTAYGTWSFVAITRQNGTGSSTVLYEDISGIVSQVGSAVISQTSANYTNVKNWIGKYSTTKLRCQIF